MRRILVENARRKKSLKQGGNFKRHNIELEQFETRRPPDEVLALHEALDVLAQRDPLKAELVKLRYFVGMTVPEAAEILGISPSSIDRQWAYTRAWLHQQVTGYKGDTSE